MLTSQIAGVRVLTSQSVLTHAVPLIAQIGRREQRPRIRMMRINVRVLLQALVLLLVLWQVRLPPFPKC